MSWKPTPGRGSRRVRPNRRRPSNAQMVKSGRWILIALVAVNVGVVFYHGDPRELLDSARPVSEVKKSKRSQAPKPVKSADTGSGKVSANAQASSSAQTESDAQTDSDAQTESAAPQAAPVVLASRTRGQLRFGFAGTLAAHDPLLGMRSPAAVQRVQNIKMKRNQTVAGMLAEAGVKREDVHASISSLASLVDFRRIRPGDRFKARFDGADTLVSLEVKRGVLDEVRTDRQPAIDGSPARWQATRIEREIDTVVAEVSGRVDMSLWVSLVDRGGEDPRLVHDIVEVFAWDLDFYTEVYAGDTYSVVVEKRYVDGQFLGYGPILAAEFVSAGHPHRAFAHRMGASGDKAVVAYYDQEGQSMRKQLLKAPLKYANVTSRFGKRRHPILGYTRAHNGIDYGVPSGTPIWSVGDGRVTKAGRNGGYGRFVAVRHANGWTSHYAHLSRIDVKVGQRVVQKEGIGAVGSTGLATGPHLHYELKHHGGFVNPLTQKFERGKSLKGSELQDFLQTTHTLQAQLKGMHVAQARPVNNGEKG